MVLYAVAALVSLGMGSVFALLAELQDAHDLPTWSLGLVSASAFIAALVVQLTLARYADRGHGGLILKAGVACASLSLFWFGFATELWQLVAARALLGAGSGLFLPAARRAVIIADPSRQAERLGTLYGAFLGGFVFGPPIAAFVAERTNLHVPFLGLGGIIALGLVGLVGVRVPGSDGPATSSKGVLRQLARNRTVLAAVLVVIAFRFSIGVFEPIWARFLTDKGASTFVIGLSLTVFAAPMIVVAPIGGRFADRHGARWASLVAGCATVPFMASYGWFSSVVVISGLALAHGLFEAIESPGSQAAVADAAPREHAAAAQGLAEAGGSAAAAIAALATAPFYAWAGAEWTWMAAAAVMAAVFGLSALLDPPQRRTLGEGGRPGPLRTDRLAGAGAGAEAVP